MKVKVIFPATKAGGGAAGREHQQRWMDEAVKVVEIVVKKFLQSCCPRLFFLPEWRGPETVTTGYSPSQSSSSASITDHTFMVGE